MRLVNAQTPEEIGSKGPAVAALPSSEDDDAPNHLRLYEAVFGRDSLRVASELLPLYPKLAAATLLELAKHQGVRYNAAREEEPGRIPHEIRADHDPIARSLTRQLGWDWPYYGSVDATPEFVRTLCAYCDQENNADQFLKEEYIGLDGEKHSLAHALSLSTRWILKRLDANPDNLLEFQSAIAGGIENQAWKDSWDAYHHADGSLANHRGGIASVEVQASAYDALIMAAPLFENRLHQSAFAETLRQAADRLRQSVLDNFWTEERGGYFVLGTDHDEQGRLRQMKIRTSNMGHLLDSKMLATDEPSTKRKVDSLVQHLLGPDMLNVSGIRTLARDEVRFRPGAYHNGSVWLWDTHVIASGLRRHGFEDAADDLDRRIINVANQTHIFPEYVRGGDDDAPSINNHTIRVYDEIYSRINQVEQPPQEIQAWTVAAILSAKKRFDRLIKFP